MPELPGGTVTFLFTDIEGSTRLWEQHPKAMRLALARHDELLRQAIEANNGVVFKTIGDAFCAAFATAPEALSAAIRCHLLLLNEEWGEIGSLKVRIALHTGEAQQRDGDYFGQTLGRVARLQAIGHGQQTLLSQSACQFIGHSLPPGATLQDMGQHRLKDLLAPEHVWQLLHPLLPSEFPPLKSLSDLTTNLPHQMTSFIGRERELQELKQLLPSTPLLTLLGTGGAGKTRLALQIGAEMLDNYKDGVWLVELAGLTDPDLVIPTAAAVLGLREETGRPLLQTTLDYLRDRQLLLLLDNCEHVVDACASLADALLRACRHLTILTTSREALGIAGERYWRIPPLLTPAPDELPHEEKDLAAVLIEYDACRLFVERAVMQRQEFVLTRSNVPVVAQLCRQLDGIPLAIELAAARVRSLSVEQINSKLDNRFRLLTGGSRTALPRQQTLRALIDWSYDLLNEREKALLCRLSIFAGGWTLESAEAVGAGENIAEWEVLDLLTSLVDKSLIVIEQEQEPPRYRLLETVRQYARERLEERGEDESVRGRHAAFFVDFAVQVSTQLRGPSLAAGMKQMQAEQENLRAALEWNLQSGEAENGARLALAMNDFWDQSGSYREGVDWLRRLIPIVEARLSLDVLVEVLMAAASFYWRMGEYDSARNLLDRAIPLARSGGNTTSLRRALTILANTVYYQGEFAASRPLYAECLELSRQAHDEVAISRTLNNLALVDMDAGDDDTAQELFEEALAMRRKQGNLHGVANVLGSLGELAARQGKYDKARRLLQEALGLVDKNTHKPLYSEIIRSLVPLKVQEGDRNEACRLMAECVQIRRETDDKWGIAVVLEDAADLIAAEASAEACTLLAAAQSPRDTIGAPRTPVQNRKHHECTAMLHERLQPEAFARAWSYGSALNAAQAVEHAIAALKTIVR